MKSKSKNTILLSVFLIIGFLIGYLVFDKELNCDRMKYKYINPELVCKEKLVVRKNNYVALKRELERLVREEQKQKRINDVAIYFRDLHNGPTFGINEYDHFSPASLLKLPLFLTYLKLEIEQPGLLSSEIYFDGAEDELVPYYPPKVKAENNTQYSIQGLLDLMIKYSDNNSYYVLREYLNEISPDKDLMRQTFVDLGIIDPQGVGDQTISVKSYAGIFTQLYHNSFFPNRDFSERALDVLANVDFKEGINLGIPQDIKVAHKFGERFYGNTKEAQLHDCGVVYFPENPYVLCIMTRGPDFFILSQFMGKISNMVYEEFNSRKI